MTTPLIVACAQRALSTLPPFVGSRVIRHTLRGVGISIGDATTFWGVPKFAGDPRRWLKIGSYCGFNVEAHFELCAAMEIEDHVAIGHEVTFLAHEPIHIGAGAWIGARAVIMPGVTIGAGSVIGAATIVRKDVPDNMLLSGTRRISLARWR